MFENQSVGLQNPRIKGRKPNLVLCGNHFKSGARVYRVWDRGTAVVDGKGWYVERNPRKKALKGSSTSTTGTNIYGGGK